MIYVTHDQTEALTFADTVVVMHDGGVVQSGRPDELFERPDHTFVGHFIGSPGMNVLPATVSGASARVGGHEIALNRQYPALPATARVELGIRPEYAVLAPRGTGIPVQVERIDDLGRVRFARLRIGDLRLSAIAPESVSVQGSEAGLTVDLNQVHIYADSRRVTGEAL